MMRPLQTVSAPNKDRWLLSYADLLTLLLAFFCGDVLCLEGRCRASSEGFIRP